MNKKGLGPIGFVLLIVIFFIFWGVWLAEWINDAGQLAITENSLTGVEAFFFANLNLWILLSLILGTIAFMRFGGGE